MIIIVTCPFVVSDLTCSELSDIIDSFGVYMPLIIIIVNIR